MAAIIIAISILIASICCGTACLILVIKRYKVRNMYLVDLSNLKQNNHININEQEEETKEIIERNKEYNNPTLFY